MSTITEQVLEKINRAPVETRQRKEELGQEEFLSLMVAQVQNQDPFSPMENGEFIAQMAQFASVEGIGEMQQSLESLAESITASQTLAASSLVGRGVMSPGNDFELGVDGDINGAIDAPLDASQMRVTVYNSAGAIVNAQQFSTNGQQSVPFNWNGFDTSGARAEPGRYRVEAVAMSLNDTVAADVSLRHEVTSVTVGQGGSSLKLNLDNGTSMDFSQVREFV